MLLEIKKVAAVILTASMAVGLCACSGGKSSSGSAASTSTHYDKVVYSYASFNNIPDAKTLVTLENAINKITEKKIGVQVVLKPIAIADYSSNTSLALQGGDQIDVFESLGNFNTCASTDMAYDLTDIMDKDASATKKLMGTDLLASCTKDGKLYGIPTYKPYALTPMVIYKKDTADKLGINMSNVKSLNDLTDVLRKVKKAYPSISPFVPGSQGNPNFNMCAGNVDYLTDDYSSPKGVLMGNSKTVVDFYGTNEFLNICKTVRTWYNEGLILKDAATTTSSATELMSSDNSFCYVASYSYPTADAAASLKAQCGGKNLGAVQIGNAFLDTTAVNAVSWMVSSTSKVPESALKFLNLTYTDKDVINLLIYGIKGTDYVLDSDGYASYPTGKDAASVSYTAQLSCGTLGNYFEMYPMAGTSKSSLTWEEDQNKKAAKSSAMGFTFDSSSLKTQYTAVSNVVKQYLPGLLCGSVDSSTVLPTFKAKLSSAGLNTIIAAKQTQLNKWFASKK